MVADTNHEFSEVLGEFSSLMEAAAPRHAASCAFSDPSHPDRNKANFHQSFLLEMRFVPLRMLVLATHFRHRFLGITAGNCLDVQRRD